MKLIKLLNAKRVLALHSHENMNSAKIAYKIFQFISKIEDGAERFFMERMNAILTKYKPDLAPGYGFQTTEDKQEALDAEIAELENVDVEAPAISFTLDEIEPMRLSASDIAALKDFIVEE